METMNLDDVSKVLKISKATARNRLSLGLPKPPMAITPAPRKQPA
jgi:hypothetical protein